MGKIGRYLVALAAVIVGVMLLGQVVGWDRLLPNKGPMDSISGPPPTHGFLALDFGQSQEAPLSIHRVLDSGAADVGIQPGDVILSIGNVSDPSRDVVQRALQSTKPGDELPLTIRRDENEFVARFRLIGYQQYTIAMREPAATRP